MKIKNKNKSNFGKKHVCDFCGADGDGPNEDLWGFGDSHYLELYKYQGHAANFCYEHFRLAHDDEEEFDLWYERFNSKEEPNFTPSPEEDSNETKLEDSSDGSVSNIIDDILSGTS